jgi:hypothetical protein
MQAQRLLQDAKEMLVADQPVAAVLMLNEIVDRFPDSDEATEARQILDSLESQ